MNKGRRIPLVRLTGILISGLLSWLLFCPQLALGGEFRVTPIRLELDRTSKSSVITVTNDSEADLNVQMRAFEWSQDAEGKDTYTETQEIVFFPKIMTLKKDENRIIRVGIKIPAVKKEKTYRLFIEEIPRQEERKGAGISMVIRFGVPIFVKPLSEEPAGEISGAELSAGKVALTVLNTGNVHFFIKAIKLSGVDGAGENVYSQELSGWYLLSEAARTHESSVPEDVCDEIKILNIEVVTDRLTLDGQVEVKEGMCEQ